MVEGVVIGWGCEMCERAREGLGWRGGYVRIG